MDCAECPAYLATKNNDQALREKTVIEYTESGYIDCTPDIINCTGCKGEDVLFVSCSNCGMRKCAMEQGIENCGACVDFNTCKGIKYHITLF